ncbi:MAG: hypothetical protein LBK42_13595 [Propionibacteriaceae bacterium]|jgi:multiple sugar transport system substrate-binding protein|nr:hypothetical protein [Propionibacteriaceae bacterium]
MNLRKPVALGLAVALAAGLAACGSDDTGPVDEAGTVTLTVAAPQADWLEPLATAFRNDYPEIEVVFAPLADDPEAARQALDTADVVTVSDLGQLAEWIQDKKVLDVTDIATTVTAEAILAYVQTSADESGAGVQTAYGVPYAQSGWLLFYNADLFQQAGAAAPDGTWLWTDFVTAAKNLTDKLRPAASGTFLPADPLAVAGLALAQNGDASLLSGGDYSFLQAYYQRAVALSVAGATPDYADAQQESTADVFLAQQAALVLAPASLATTLAAQADFAWGMAPVPQRDKLTAGVDKTPVTVGDPVGCVIPSGIDPSRLDAAKAWLGFIASSKAAVLLAAQGVVPAVADDGVANAFWELEGLPTDALSRFAFQTHNIKTTLPLDPKAAEAWEAVAETDQTIRSAAQADAIEPALADLTEKIEQIID